MFLQVKKCSAEHLHDVLTSALVLSVIVISGYVTAFQYKGTRALAYHPQTTSKVWYTRSRYPLRTERVPTTWGILMVTVPAQTSNREWLVWEIEELELEAEAATEPPPNINRQTLATAAKY